MRKLIVIAGSVLVLGIGMSARAQDMSLGGTGAALGGSATLDGGSNAGFGNALNRARTTPGNSDMGDDGGIDTNDPRVRAANGSGGSGSMMSSSPGASGAAAQPAPKKEPRLYGGETGESLLSELLRGGGGRPAPRARRISLRSSRNAPLAKYKLPARGYLAYYLPADRYKVASSDWRYVAIEDDAGRYPARYYYPPTASNFLQMISQNALGARIRGNRSARVIGFHTWQEALAAGYRPDPMSKPAPGAQLARLAVSGRSAQLARYLGFVYAGQVPGSSFDATYNYALNVQRIANSRKDTRRYAGQAVGQVLIAALGEGPRPIQVGPFGVITARPAAAATGMSAPSSSGVGSSSMSPSSPMSPSSSPSSSDGMSRTASPSSPMGMRP